MLPKKIKIERALKRKNINKKIIIKILKNQIDDKIKKKEIRLYYQHIKTKKTFF